MTPAAALPAGAAPRFQSAFAPLTPDGPLPPGLDAATLRTAYQDGSTSPRHVLSVLGIKHFNETAAERLRKALTVGENRRRLAKMENGRIALHIRLFLYLAQRAVYAKGVFLRLVKPCIEEPVKPRRPVNPARFAELLAKDYPHRSILPAHLSPRTELAALAEFAFVLALFQPDDAWAFVTPLLELGRGFQEWFGAAPEGEVAAASAPAAMPVAPAGPTPAAPVAVAEPQPPPTKETTPQTPPPAVREASGQPAQPVPPPAHAPAPKPAPAQATAPATEPLPKPLGPRAAQMMQVASDLASTRRQRCAVGAQETLDDEALIRLAKQEKALSERQRELGAGLHTEAKAAVAALNATLQRFIHEPAFAVPSLGDDAGLAAWLDEREPQVTAVQELALRVEEQESVLRELLPGSALPVETGPCSELEQARVMLIGRSERLTRSIAEAEALHAMNERLKGLIEDCGRPGRAASLTTLGPEHAAALLKATRWNAELHPLAPLCLRWLAEAGGWASGAPSPEGLEAARDALQHEARTADPDRHHALTAYLPPEMMESLLLTCDEVLVRHAVAATFQESVARQQPTFFARIWPLMGRHGLRSLVGHRLERLFEAFQQSYLQDTTLRSLFNELVEPGQIERDEESIASERRQMAEMLAGLLSDPTGMTGHHKRLRLMASERLFRPLVPAVRQRRVLAVQAEVMALLRRNAGQGLAEEIRHAFDRETGLGRELGTQHHTNLRRYIDERLQRLQDWVRDELDLRASFERPPAALEDEVKQLAWSLPEGGGEDAPGQEGWLEGQVGRALAPLRRGEHPDWAPANFGELPSLAALFGEPEPSSVPVAGGPPGEVGGGKWPAWLEPGPRSERLWVCRVEDHYTWRDLLQDGIAHLFLGRSGKRPAEVLQAFVAAGELEAALDAVEHGPQEFQAPPECQEIARKARASMAERIHLESACEDLERRRAELVAGAPAPADAKRLAELEGELIEALDSISRTDAAAVRDRLAGLDRELAAIRQRLSRERDLLSRRYEALEDWLEEAGLEVPPDAPLAELEARREEHLRRSASRRQHLLQLQRFSDPPGVPEQLRNAARAIVRELDQPSRWPPPDASADAAFYLEYLASVAGDWWAGLRVLAPGEGAHVRISEICRLLEQRLGEEVGALLQQRHQDAPMLTALMERGTSEPATYHRLLVDRRLLRSALEAGPAQPSRRQRTLDKALDRLEAVLAPEPSGNAGDVNIALSAFERGDFVTAEKVGLRAWSWASDKSAESDRSLTAAVVVWSRWRLGARGVDARHAGDALALLWRSAERFQRDRDAVHRELVDGWLHLLPGQEGAPGGERTVGQRLNDVLSAIATALPADPARESLAALWRASDATFVSQAFWAQITGVRDQAKGRLALLLLLHQAGEMEALSRFFNQLEPTNEALLQAFVTMVNRASTDSTPKLISAIRHNLRSLNDRVRNAALKEFAKQVAEQLKLPEAQLELSLLTAILERAEGPNAFHVTLRIRPDQADPPLNLNIELLPHSDFAPANGAPGKWAVAEREGAILDEQEVSFLVTPKDPRAAHVLALRAEGSTVGGQVLSQTFRFDVEVEAETEFIKVPEDEMLDIYAGYDAKPVSGESFVGRDDELKNLQRNTTGKNPGAVVVYGTRRLGKTSLLDGLRERSCASRSGTSRTLFVVVPVDLFEVPSDKDQFLPRFFRHIHKSLQRHPKNAELRSWFQAQGMDTTALQRLGQFGPDWDDASFYERLSEYVARLLGPVRAKADQVILVFDEFDKLLEAYHRGVEEAFEQLLNELRHAATEDVRIGMVLSGSDLLGTALQRYRSALFGSAATIQLKPFNEPAHRDDAKRIISPDRIRGKVVFSEEVIGEIINVCGGHPLFMRLVACACATLTQAERRRRVSIGVVHKAVRQLLQRQVLQGNVPDPVGLILNPLQAIALMERKEDESLAWLLLLHLVRHVSFEKQWTPWAVVTQDDTLERLQPPTKWSELRDVLRTSARLLERNDRSLWSFTYPVIAEALRVDWEASFEKYLVKVAPDRRSEGFAS